MDSQSDSQPSSGAPSAEPETGWRSRLKRGVRWFVALSMVAVGIAHFVDPEPFMKIVPAALPAPLALVLISGVFEVLGGVGLLIERTRNWAGWGLIALYLAVFPANINMAINRISFDEANPIPEAALWGRLPFQLVFIALAYWVSRPDKPAQ